MQELDEQKDTNTPSVTGSWYSKIPSAEREVIDATAKWLAPIRWQLFVTFTFPWKVTASTADSYFKTAINKLEKALRQRICYFAGKERKPRSFGSEVPWHFHLVMAAQCPITADLVITCWQDLVGKGTRTLTHPQGDSVDVRMYDPAKRGIEYCIKMSNDCDTGPLFRWLELFNPKIPKVIRNHRGVRQRKRFGQQEGMTVHVSAGNAEQQLG